MSRVDLVSALGVGALALTLGLIEARLGVLLVVSYVVTTIMLKAMTRR